jgi:hypothetical protein
MVKFAPHATLQTNWQGRKCGKGGEECARWGSQKRTGENPGNAGSFEYQEKESNLHPGLFSVSGEGDSPSSLTSIELEVGG